VCVADCQCRPNASSSNAFTYIRNSSQCTSKAPRSYLSLRLCGLVVRARGPRFYCRHYQIFWEVVGLERGPLSLVSTTEELLEREYGRRDQSRWPRGNLYPQKLALSSSTSGGRSVGIVRSREFSFYRCFVSQQAALLLISPAFMHVTYLILATRCTASESQF
jgi:hypothetical protein